MIQLQDTTTGRVTNPHSFSQITHPVAGREFFESGVGLDVLLDVLPRAGERDVVALVEHLVERGFLLFVQDVHVTFVKLLFLRAFQGLNQIPALVLAQNAFSVAP